MNYDKKLKLEVVFSVMMNLNAEVEAVRGFIIRCF